MTNSRDEALLTSLRLKLDFIRQTPVIFIAWLLFAMAVAMLGWGVVLANLEETRTGAKQHALVEAAALARTHADRLLRSINTIDQITHHIRVEWVLTGGQLRLEQLKREKRIPATVHVLRHAGRPRRYALFQHIAGL